MIEPSNIITGNFSPVVRSTVVDIIKRQGIKRTEAILLAEGFNRTFSKALIKNIIKKEGW